MPAVVTARPYRPVPTDPVRKRWTREECDTIEAAGHWAGQHLELIDGELINKMGKTWAHVIGDKALGTWLIHAFGGDFVHQHAPIDVSPEDNPTSEPEPDLTVLTKPYIEFPTDNPGPQDLRLVVEVSDFTVGFDLTRKAALYARAGILDYWVLDIEARRLVVHRDPHQGMYRQVTVYKPSESVAPLAAPDHKFPVGEAFPK